MEKEKPLEELTVKELKEMAMTMGTITGVSAMKKAELIQAIKEAKGVPVKEVREKPIETVVKLKQRIRALKEEKGVFSKAGERAKIDFLRRKISRLKKRTRRLAREKAS
jgi:phage terminase Nu1 subunit (DNA packaging protein)